ncbi:MAG: cation-translocating P-type ATPase [Clostridiales Family XIII bacterium]|jgi:Ca2+-transporting ATPase|nr:cation-translocating P-type ATPase [Clostridiales Family XIII bacterium]
MNPEKVSAEAVLAEQNVDRTVGLSSAEAAKRLAENGRNEFDEQKKKTLIASFFSQMNDPMIYILLAATIVSVILGEYTDAVIIIAIVLLNAVIGVVQESKAEKSLEALKKLSSPFALVRRDGGPVELPAAELACGDIVLLEAGRIVPADLRLIETVNLKIEESALTGESVPVDKDAAFVADGDITIGDRINMAYLSTGVSYGRGEGVVIATGMETEMGRIARMISEEKDELTPLQKKLAGLGKVLGILALGICAALFLVAILQGRDMFEMLLTAISLAVAAIPEGLPAVVTIVLALGVQRMVKVHTIVRKLPAVETLGSVSVVCSDKTGTLTQNKMSVTKVWTGGEIRAVSDLSYENDKLFVDGFVLCTDAEIDTAREVAIGDPTELALLYMGGSIGVSKETLDGVLPRVAEQSFDSERKMMTTVHRRDDGEIIAFTKGATDNVIEHCVSIYDGDTERPITDADKERILQTVSAMAEDALRVLALACKRGDESAAEEGLTFVGLVGMIDPPRPEAAGAVAEFKEASVTTIMITGDHKDTAFAIAKEIGIAEHKEQVISGVELDKLTQEELNAVVPSLRVFARVSPQHKVMIVKAFKSHGHIVSMTGDGVNDAPSLKAADIGVAMGITGTDVSKGAADMILTDDNFATIKLAIREGRNIYGNIRETVLFLLSSNLGEIITMFGAIAAGLLAPLRAIHILWINLITDSLPALALGVDEAEDDIMKRPPRGAKEGLFSDGGAAATGIFGVLIGFMTLAAFLYEPVQILISRGQHISISSIDAILGSEAVLVRAQTFAFTTLGVSQLFNAIGFKKLDRSLFKTNHLRNKMMIAAFVFGFALQIAVTEVPFLTEVFSTASLSLNEWLVLTIWATLPLWVHEIFRIAHARIRARRSIQRKEVIG